MAENVPVPPTGAAAFATELKELRERIRVLETAPRAPQTSLSVGYIELLDDQGRRVATLGQGPGNTRVRMQLFDPAAGGQTVTVAGQIALSNINPVGTEVDTGILVQDTLGNDIFQVTKTRGFMKPMLQWDWRSVNVSKTNTSATFTSDWQAIISSVPSTAVRVKVSVNVDAGTTGEIRLQNTAYGIQTSAVPITGSATVDFKWDLAGSGVPLGAEFFFNCQVRRTGGAGNVYSF